MTLPDTLLLLVRLSRNTTIWCHPRATTIVAGAATTIITTVMLITPSSSWILSLSSFQTKAQKH